MKNIFLEFLGKTLNRPADEVAALIYKNGDDGKLTEDVSESALENLLKADSERVQSLKGKDGPTFDDGHKAGKKEAMEALEKRLRRHYAFEGEARDADALISAIVAQSVKAETDEDKIKVSSAYLALEKKMADAIEATKAEWEGKVKEIETQTARNARLTTARENAKAILNSLNPVLPSNPAAAERQVNAFMSVLADLDFEEKDGTIILSKNGKRVENAQGYPVNFDDFVKSEATNFFDFKQQEQAGNAGNSGSASGNGGTGFQIPKTKAEALEMFYKSDNVEEKAALTKFMSDNAGA